MWYRRIHGQINRFMQAVYEENIMSFDAEQYEKAIPDCCVFRTAREHFDNLLLCWGLLAAIERGEPMLCGECEFATRKTEVVEEKC